LKSEHLQKTGSFKIRGATNKVIQSVHEGAKYVTAASSGNHGQALAYIANCYGIPATVVVPEDVSLCKVNAITAYKGSVEKCGTTSAERLPRAKEIAIHERGVFIPPCDDPFIMAGQGTIGLEILEQLQEIDLVIVPIGGGGLISGILTAIKETNPKIKVIGVEPAIANDTYLSLQNKEITSIQGTSTIADGLRTNQPGDVTFPVIMKYLDDIVLVSEAEIRQAFSFVLERMKQLIEPSSATTVAAAIFNKIPVKGKKVVTVISGGNVDLDKVPDLLVDTPR
jgi:threonine dehydratase